MLTEATAFVPQTRVYSALTTRGIGVGVRTLPPKQPLRIKTRSTSHLRQVTAPLYVSLSDPDLEEQEIESWEDDSKFVELVLLTAWGVAISAFILINNFIGPWPAAMAQVPERVWFVLHMLGGMLFGGGVILTTCIEWLVAHNRNSPVAVWWFDKVPLLDAAIVLPALTMAMVSGTGLAIEHYGGLGVAPIHISLVFYALVAFGKKQLASLLDCTK